MQYSGVLNVTTATPKSNEIYCKLRDPVLLFLKRMHF